MKKTNFRLDSRFTLLKTNVTVAVILKLNVVSVVKYFALIAEIMSGVTTLLGLLLIINGNLTEEENSTSTMRITANITDSNETNMTTTFSYSLTDSTTFLSSTPTTTRKAKTLVDEDYGHYMNVIKPIVYQVSFYVVVISVAIGLVLNPLAALVFGKSGMGRTPVGEETIFITARLAKRAKVMFSLCVSVHRRGGGPKVQYFRGGGAGAGGGVPRSNIFGWGGSDPGPGPGPAPPPEKILYIFFEIFFFFFGKMATQKMATQKMATQKIATQKWRHKMATQSRGRGRYASCGHAGGLSCFFNFWSLSGFFQLNQYLDTNYL